MVKNPGDTEGKLEKYAITDSYKRNLISFERYLFIFCNLLNGNAPAIRCGFD